MRSTAAALARALPVSAWRARRAVSIPASCPQECRRHRPEVLARVAMLALEEQEDGARAYARRAAGRGVHSLDDGQEDGPPATPLCADQPVSLLVVDEEALVEGTDVGERGAAQEEACPGRGVHPPPSR